MSYSIDISEVGIKETFNNIKKAKFRLSEADERNWDLMDKILEDLEYWQETLERIMYILQEEQEDAVLDFDGEKLKSIRERLDLIKLLTGNGDIDEI